MKRSRSSIATWLLPLAPLIVAGVLSEVAVRRGWIPSYLVPAPSTIAHTLLTETDLWRATGETAVASLVGFSLSAVIGVAIAVVLSSARWVLRTFYPYAVVFQTVPLIAIAPMLVIWIGFGMPTVITSAFIVSVFPVIANSIHGLSSTDPALLDLFRLYGAKRAAILWKLRLPFALPAILTGLRVAGGLAVIGAIVGEFITGGGLGGIIDASRTQQRIDRVFAVLLLASGLGITSFGAVEWTSRRVLRNWHPTEAET